MDEKERRRSKRSQLKVTIQIQRIDKAPTSHNPREVTVDIVDLSMDGIGFITKEELELDAIYDAKFEIWTKEALKTVIKIVRISKGKEYNTYGAHFVGMADADRFKVNVYQLFHNEV